MEMGKVAPVERAEDRRQAQPARDNAAQKITPQMNGAIPTTTQRSPQFTDWASI